MQIFSDRNLERIRAGHRMVKARTTSAVAEVSAEAGQRAVDYAKARPRFTPRSPGGLATKNEWRTVRIAGGRLVRVRNTKKYAAAIDKGARPHIIRASEGGYLHFLGKRGWVRKRQVRHPGNKPYRFLHSATMTAGREMGPKLQQRMQRIARDF